MAREARALVLTLAWLAGAAAQTPPPVIQPTDLAAAMLWAEFPGGGEQRGAGIIVGQDSDQVILATAAHVLVRDGEPASSIEVFFAHEKVKEFVGVRRCASLGGEVDVALVSVEAPGLSALPLNTIGDSRSIVAGSMLLPVGNGQQRTWDRPPAALEFDPSGPSSFISYRSANVALVEHVTDGFSGGPLFDVNGSIVGMHLLDAGDRRRALPIERVVAVMEACSEVSVRRRISSSMKTGPICVGDVGPCETLRRWKVAYEREDLIGLEREWPGLRKQVLDGNFRDAKSVAVEWECGRMDVRGREACVRCGAVRYRYDWSDPSRTANRQSGEQFELSKRANGTWFIARIRPWTPSALPVPPEEESCRK